LGSLVVIVGSTEMFKEMASYTTNQKAFVARTFYSSGGSCVAVERQYIREIPVCVAKSRGTIYRIFTQFEEIGSVYVKRGKGRKGRAFVRMEEDVTIKKIATFITKFLVLDQHCMENLA
jgi:hypothetical protein